MSGPPSARAGAPRVLVIDDDASLRAVVRVALTAQGWVVSEALDTAEGLAFASRDRPDVILLDIVFPGEARDGFSVCRELRSMRATKDIPIVLFTAHDDPEHRAFASAVGATAYLVKPFGTLDLLRMLRLVQGPSGGQPGLGLYLIDAGVISPAQLERALVEQRLRQSPRPKLGEILVELGFASAEAVRLALVEQRRAREQPSAAQLPTDLRVVIADDHASVRDGLRSAIAAEDGLSVVGIAIDGDEALRQIRTLQPDLVILDNDMPRRSGIEVLRAVSAEHPQIAVVMFTLDDSIRDAAIAAGAAAVVAKDRPLRVLIAEMRRAANARLPNSPARAGVVLAARSVARRAWGVLLRRKRGLAAMGVMGVAYAGGFLVVEPVLGASAAVLQLVPVAAAGALLGVEAGVAAAILFSALTVLLWQGTGNSVGEPILTVGGNGLGVLALVGLGASFGLMRAVRGRVDPTARRAGALAESAFILASGGGPETLRLLALAALDVVPGDAALLFLPVPGGGLELVAASGVPRAALGSRRVGDAVARAQTHGRPAIVDAGAASIGVEVARMREAIVVPLAAPGHGLGGAIAVLSMRRGAYHDQHLHALGTYAAFVRITITARLATVEGPVGQAVERGGAIG
ncbi:MAG TPA: response regulator [Candidatus Limnocylindria bacterium]|nr:response regulator [Candidatus Limnocylindria bacterium]